MFFSFWMILSFWLFEVHASFCHVCSLKVSMLSHGTEIGGYHGSRLKIDGIVYLTCMDLWNFLVRKPRFSEASNYIHKKKVQKLEGLKFNAKQHPKNCRRKLVNAKMRPTLRPQTKNEVRQFNPRMRMGSGWLNLHLLPRLENHRARRWQVVVITAHWHVSLQRDQNFPPSRSTIGSLESTG